MDCENSGGRFNPFDAYRYETDELGAIKGPEPKFSFSYKLNGLPSELLPLLSELAEIKDLLKQILIKL